MPLKCPDIGLLPRFRRIRTVTRKDGLLYCSCCFRQRYGIDCSHIYNVVSQFQSYTEPSHHECALRWWSSYSLYGLAFNSSNTENEKNLMRTYEALQRTEYTGLPVFNHVCSNVPIQTFVPSYFQRSDFPNCLNFPHLKVLQEDVSLGNHDVTGLTQIISSYPEDALNKIIADATNSDIFSKANPKKPSDNPYAELIPYFVELTSSMEGWCDDEDFVDIKEFLTKKTSEFKGKANSILLEQGNKEIRRKREIVSSSIPSGKKKKAHGTKHY